MNLPARIAPEPTVELPPLFQRPSAWNARTMLHWSAAENSEPFAPGRWRLEGSPAVILAARGIFSGVISKKVDACSWPAVEPSFDDLLMLQHRFPIEISDSARAQWEKFYAATVIRYRACELGDDGAIAQGRPDRRFTGKLLTFQEEGERFLIAARRTLLADDMGLGKTPVALSAMDRVDSWPVVIVCQPHVIRHWERKTEEFLGAVSANSLLRGQRLSWVTLHGAKAKGRIPKSHIYIVHYLVLQGWVSFLLRHDPYTVVFDEVQELRHQGTNKYDAAAALARAAAHVWGLSGTPIYNRGPEIYNVYQALYPGALGTKTDFHQNWCGYDSLGKLIVESPDVLGSYLRDRHLMLRRRKSEVQSQLPGKRRAIEPIQADNGLFSELIKTAVELAKNAESIADPFDRARMEAEAIAETRRATGVAKAPAAIAFLRGLMEAEAPTLVFAHHHAVHDAIREHLADYKPTFITGLESMKQKDDSRTRFINGDTDLCVIALRSATGIDGLQSRARVVVFVELDWSPAVHWQAEDRAHRMGQKNSVIVYYLVTDLGSDPYIMMTLNVKEDQFTGLMHDPVQSPEDRANSAAEVKNHTASVLDMLRKMR